MTVIPSRCTNNNKDIDPVLQSIFGVRFCIISFIYLFIYFTSFDFPFYSSINNCLPVLRKVKIRQNTWKKKKEKRKEKKAQASRYKKLK